MSNELARAKKKFVAIKRAERRLQTTLENIDWEFDVLLPQVEALGLAAAEQLELPEFTVEIDEN
jgi:hypothetical protein